MAKTYYVSSSAGNDKNPGTDKKPLKSIQAGVNKLSAGDTLLVRTGTYTEQIVINRSGDDKNPITIQAYPNERPMISGQGIKLGKNTALVSITRCRYVTFSGFDVQDSRARGISVGTASHVTLDDCHVQQCVANGISVINCQDSLVQKCVVHACAQDYISSDPNSVNTALYVSRSTNVVVKGNKCYENPAAGIGLFSVLNCVIRENTSYDNRSAQIALSSARDTVVDSNLCYHTGRQQFLHLSGGRPPGIVKVDRKAFWTSGYWHTRNLLVTNNIVVGCASGFESPANGGALTAVNVIHNTFVNNTDAAFRIADRSPHTASVVENNLVANTNGGAMSQVATAGGLIWRHNFWSQMPADASYNPVNDVIDPNTGLRDINAPVVAGALSTAPYELTAVSPAINVGIRSVVSVDYYGRARDTKPDIGAHELDNSQGAGEDQPELPPTSERVTSGLQVLYDFSAGWGNTVADVSGVGSALDLTIQNTAAVQWANQGLIIKSPTTITSSGPATKVINACKSSDEITIEAWVTPATTNQGGPSRIVSISADPNNRNTTLAQGLKPGEPTTLYNVRLRTSNSNDNGIPSLSSAANSLQAQLTHVVFTRDQSGNAILYINGQERAVDRLTGSFNNWAANYPLLLANERTGDRPWLGTYTLAAIYSRALTSGEVQHNYNAGLPQADPLSAEFRIRSGQSIGIAPHTVDFDSSDSYAADSIASYAWTFGDGQTSGEPNPTHVYEKTGIYTVSLTITDSKGLTNTRTRPNFITVTDSVLPALPVDYARFVVANIVESRVLAFGIQYPDFRSILAWNSEPFPILIYRSIEDVVEKYEVPGTIEIIWIDYPDAIDETDE